MIADSTYSETGVIDLALVLSDVDENGVDRNQMRIVLVGETGEGKSATANTILGKKFFVCKRSARSVTGECSKKEAIRFGKNVMVVDTPGIFDTNRNHVETMSELVKCIAISTPGPHAFIIVISALRFTYEGKTAIDEFLKHFSEKALDYSVVVFTGRDKLEDDGIDIAEYVETLPQSMKTLLQKCGNRYIAFNNKSDRSVQEEDVKRLFGILEQIMEGNGGSCYTSEMYAATERALREKMAKIQDAEKRKTEKESKIKDQEELKREIIRLKKEFNKHTEPKNLRAEAVKNAEKKKGPLGQLAHGVRSIGEVLTTPLNVSAAFLDWIDNTYD